MNPPCTSQKSCHFDVSFRFFLHEILSFEIWMQFLAALITTMWFQKLWGLEFWNSHSKWLNLCGNRFFRQRTSKMTKKMNPERNSTDSHWHSDFNLSLFFHILQMVRSTLLRIPAPRYTKGGISTSWHRSVILTSFSQRSSSKINQFEIPGSCIGF